MSEQRTRTQIPFSFTPRNNLVELIVVRTPGTPEQLSRLRQQLLAKTTAELNAIADEQTLAQYRAQAARQVATEQNPRLVEAEQQLRAAAEKLAWSRIFGTVINGRVATENQANRSIISSWINFDEEISPAWFVQVLKDNPKLTESLTWQSAKSLDPKWQKQAIAVQDDQDRKTFNQFARANGFSPFIEANFYLAKSVLGSGFDQYSLGQAVQSGQVQFAQATPEELAEFQQETARQRVAYLASLPSGHPDIKADLEQRRQEFQRAEQERQIAQREKADAQYDGYVPLPEFNLETGDKIDAAYLNRISNTNLQLFKALMRKHGGAALTRRLNGRG